MEYKGKLYGKVGKNYFPMVETANDFDNLKKKNAELLEVLQNLMSVYEEKGQLLSFDVSLARNVIEKATKI